jgi:pyruvate,water dikinase
MDSFPSSITAMKLQSPPPATAADPETDFLLWYADTRIEDLLRVGGKNASLGEMYRELAAQGVRVPNGFSITAEAYRFFLSETGVGPALQEILGAIDTRNLESLRLCGKRARTAILEAPMPPPLSRAVLSAYKKLKGNAVSDPAVAVRSSATAEDLPDASFAGQQETYLNIRGAEPVLKAVQRCFASLFTDRALSYRADQGFDQMQIALSVGIQQMVRSDLATSGVLFTLDTETGFRDVVLINAAYGLGENVVQGAVNPDEYTVFKPTLQSGFAPILHKVCGTKELKLVLPSTEDGTLSNVPVPESDRSRFALEDTDILTLARWACLIEAHYQKKRGHPVPMDIEWAKDGCTGELFIVQARPETVQSLKTPDTLANYRLLERSPVLLKGRSVGDKIAVGNARVIQSAQFLEQFKEGDILVTDKTDPDWEPVMKKAAAIVTNRGGRTCHAAIVSRELGVPAIVGTENGTETLKNGQAVTVSCAEGQTGFVYEGQLPFDVEHVRLTDLGKPRTRVMLNVGNPDEAFALSFLPNDGVGLAREEFIITSSIQVHPMALLEYDTQPSDLRRQIDTVTRGYPDKPAFFVEKLAQGVARIAAAFYPKDVIVRMSDFKTNEYAHLIGGSAYEPAEENPMLGFRGASRYYHPRYAAGFALECRAMKKVRDEMGLTNLKLMIPFCRTVEEGRRVHEALAKNGLRRGENGLEIYVMCEIPSNVILAEEFTEIFDGFSIGSNDLTQLILGVDRDSEIVAPLFDERNPAVKKMIAQVIAVCRAKGRKIGICGQAPSDYPEFAQFLVQAGIDSVSLNPDTLFKTTAAILQIERGEDAEKLSAGANELPGQR